MINTAAPGAGFHHSYKLCLVVLTLGLLSCCHSAPSKPGIEWWNQPCNTDLPPKMRHERSTSDEVTKIRNQLKIFHNSLKAEIKKINILYKIKEQKGTPTSTPNAKFEWLKISKMLKKMTKAPTPKKLLAILYDSAQRFAGTMEFLRQVEIQTDIPFRQSDRDSIYQNTTYRLRSLLCEIYEILKQTPEQTTVPKKLSLSDIMNNNNNNKPPISNKLDLTAGHIIDYNFLNKTASFFNRTLRTVNKQLRKLKKKNSAKNNKKSKRINKPKNNNLKT